MKENTDAKMETSRKKKRRKTLTIFVNCAVRFRISIALPIHLTQLRYSCNSLLLPPVCWCYGLSGHLQWTHIHSLSDVSCLVHPQGLYWWKKTKIRQIQIWECFDWSWPVSVHKNKKQHQLRYGHLRNARYRTRFYNIPKFHNVTIGNMFNEYPLGFQNRNGSTPHMQHTVIDQINFSFRKYPPYQLCSMGSTHIHDYEYNDKSVVNDTALAYQRTHAHRQIHRMG